MATRDQSKILNVYYFKELQVPHEIPSLEGPLVWQHILLIFVEVDDETRGGDNILGECFKNLCLPGFSRLYWARIRVLRLRTP